MLYNYTHTMPADILSRVLDADGFFNRASSLQSTGGYPKYNIIQDGPNFLVEVAAAGFKKCELSIKQHGSKLRIEASSFAHTESQNMLTDNSNHADASPPTNNKKDLTRGIAKRPFAIEFTLPEHGTVSNATYEDGILSVQVNVVIPESEMPRLIQIE